MTQRIAIAGIGVVTGALLIVITMRQAHFRDLQSQEAVLRAQQQQIELQAPSAPPIETTSSAATDPSTKMELLRLRSEVGQLMAQRKALDEIQRKNDALQARLAGRSATNSLPPGYIRTRDAQNVGMGTPKQTLETWLWAMRSRDRQMVLQLFADEVAGQVSDAIQRDDEFFETFGVPGFHVVGEERLEGGQLAVHLQVVPGDEEKTAVMIFRYIEGGWRITELR